MEPPATLIRTLHEILYDLLRSNPAAASSEKYLQHHVEFELLRKDIRPRYILRIGINYHGQKVQHLTIDPKTGLLIGWNRDGHALGIGKAAKVLLAGHTIFDRDDGEPMMNDTKIGGGEIPAGSHVKVEFKARGYLGQTKNLDGKQLEKDIDLLLKKKADLMVVVLSETAHLKWRGEGPKHHAGRRTGTDRFAQILMDPRRLEGEEVRKADIRFEGQSWSIQCQRVVATEESFMPGAEHFVSLCWRRGSGTDPEKAR